MKLDGSPVGLKRFRALWAALPVLLAAAEPAFSQTRTLDAPAGPVFSQTETIDAPPGVTLTIRLDELFDNAGTNPVFIGVGYPVTEHLDPSGTALDDDTRDSFTVTVKSAAELNALASPPPSPFTFKADVGMRNDEGQDASGTIEFRTTYARASTEPPEDGDESETTITAQQCQNNFFSSSAGLSCPSSATITVTDNQCRFQVQCRNKWWGPSRPDENLVANDITVSLEDAKRLNNCNGVLKVGSC